MALPVKDPTLSLRDAGSIPGLAQWVKNPALLRAAAEVTEAARIWHCCGYGVAAAAAAALIPPLAWQLPYAAGVTIKRKKKKKKKKNLNKLLSSFDVLDPCFSLR